MRPGTAQIVVNAEIPANNLQLAETELHCLYGYGWPDPQKAILSSESCVILVAEESISTNQTHFYEIALPEDFLIPGACNRTISVALAHSPLCRSTRIDYKSSQVAFKLVLEDNLETLAERFRHESQLENIPEWPDCSPGARLRGKGTVMATRKTIERLPRNTPLLNGEKLFLVVTHQPQPWAEDWIQEERYAVAVRIDDRGNPSARLYAQLRTRLRQRARVRV